MLRLRIHLGPLVLLFSGLLIFETFFFSGLLPALVIEGGSMLPRLLPRHQLVVCNACSFRFPHRDEPVNSGLGPKQWQAVPCPGCGKTGTLAVSGPAVKGDWVLVDRLTPGLWGYRRFDVAVLQDPERAPDWAVKRVVGLPRETLSLLRPEHSLLQELSAEEVLAPHRGWPRFEVPLLWSKGVSPDEFFGQPSPFFVDQQGAILQDQPANVGFPRGSFPAEVVELEWRLSAAATVSESPALTSPASSITWQTPFAWERLEWRAEQRNLIWTRKEPPAASLPESEVFPAGVAVGESCQIAIPAAAIYVRIMAHRQVEGPESGVGLATKGVTWLDGERRLLGHAEFTGGQLKPNQLGKETASAGGNTPFPAVWLILPQGSPERAQAFIRAYGLLGWPPAEAQALPSKFPPLEMGGNDSRRWEHRLEADSFLLIGDNAVFSRDSRVWAGHGIPRNQLIGKVRKWRFR